MIGYVCVGTNDWNRALAYYDALMGALQMIIGAAVMALAGVFANGLPQPMTYGIAACAVAAFLVTQWTLRRVAVPLASDPSTP